MEKLELMNETVTRGTVEDASNTNDPAEQVFQSLNFFVVSYKLRFNPCEKFVISDDIPQ